MRETENDPPKGYYVLREVVHDHQVYLEASLKVISCHGFM